VADHLPTVEWPAEACEFGSMDLTELVFRDYLRSRGFSDPLAVARANRLRWCVGGRWTHRVLFGYYDRDGQLVGWLGRGIDPLQARWVAEPIGIQALHQDHVWEAHGKPTRALVVCEGLVDALRVSAQGAARGVVGVATCGQQTDGQARRIEELAAGAPIAITSDADAPGAAVALARKLAHLNPVVGTMPKGFDDIAEMNERELDLYLMAMLREMEVAA